MTKENMTFLGLDDGHYAIKVCAGRGRFLTVPSSIKVGREVVSDESGQNNHELVFTTDSNEFYTITAYQKLVQGNMDTRDKDFAISSANRALGYHAMSRAEKEGLIPQGIALSVVSGLPINRFYDDQGVVNEDFIARKRTSLTLPIHNQGGVVLPTVGKHQIISEAVASFFDAAYDFEGNRNEAFFQLADLAPTAIIDIGGKTLDVAVIKEGGAGLYYSSSGTLDTGGALFYYDALNDALMKFLQERHPDAVVAPLTKEKIDTAVKTGLLFYYGQVDVKDIVEKELKSFADRIRNFVTPKLGNGSEYGSILFVGGGSNLLYNHVNQVFPNIPRQAISICEPDSDPNTNSSYSNARGMYKAALVSSMSQ